MEVLGRPELIELFFILRLCVSHASAALLRVEVALHIAQRVGVVAHAMLDEIVGLERHVKGQVLLHIGGDLSAL